MYIVVCLSVSLEFLVIINFRESWVWAVTVLQATTAVYLMPRSLSHIMTSRWLWRPWQVSRKERWVTWYCSSSGTAGKCRRFTVLLNLCPITGDLHILLGRVWKGAQQAQSAEIAEVSAVLTAFNFHNTSVTTQYNNLSILIYVFQAASCYQVHIISWWCAIWNLAPSEGHATSQLHFDTVVTFLAASFWCFVSERTTYLAVSAICVSHSRVIPIRHHQKKKRKRRTWTMPVEITDLIFMIMDNMKHK